MSPRPSASLSRASHVKLDPASNKERIAMDTPRFSPFNNTDCPPFPTNTYCDIIAGITRATGLFSVACCGFVLFVIILFQRYAFYTQRLIMYLSIAAGLLAIGVMMEDFRIASNPDLIVLCILQGIWLVYFEWVVTLLVCCFTLNILCITVKQKNTEKLEKIFLITSLGLPVLIACLPLVDLSYGPADLTCWISTYRNDTLFVPGIILQSTVFYVPFLIIGFGILGTMLYVHFTTRKQLKAAFLDPTVKSMWEIKARPLYVYPWLFIALLVPPFINKVRIIAGGTGNVAVNFIFWLLQAVTVPLLGTVFALGFTLDKDTLKRLRWRNIKGAFKQFCVKTKIEEIVCETTVYNEYVDDSLEHEWIQRQRATFNDFT